MLWRCFVKHFLDIYKMFSRYRPLIYVRGEHDEGNKLDADMFQNVEPLKG